MRPSQELLKKYAELIVCTGANVQPGQKVLLYASVEEHVFACLVAEACYRAGASRVSIEWSCDGATRLNYVWAETAELSRVYPWEEAKLKQMTEDLPCRIYIESDDPDALAGISPEKLSAVSKARGKVVKPYRNAIDGRHQWVIAALPSPRWASKCFPGLPEDEAMDRLWDAVLTTVRVTEDNDPVAVWKEHTDDMTRRADWLNRQGFVSLEYHSANGTDFTVGLIPEAHWEGAGTVNNENGIWYVPNMPTEEVFTSPKAGVCEGTLVATKPLSWNGQLIDGFSVAFKNGKAVSCKAEKGQDLLAQMIDMDETACMLGEVALVPKESPVNQCGFLFNNTLFDENACCHVALGMGFKEVLPDGNAMTTDQARAMGINDSVIHVDFMIGSDDLSITGIRADGSRAPIFIDGTWAET